MTIVALMIPAWKSKDFNLPWEKWTVPGVIYLRRLGFYYVRNPHGVKLKFSVSAAEKAFYDKAYTDKASISIGIMAVISTGNTPIIHQSITL